MFGLQRNHCQPRVFCEREVVVIFLRLLLHGGSEGGNPSAVALKGALQDKLLSHSGGIDVSLELKGCRDRENKP